MSIISMLIGVVIGAVLSVASGKVYAWVKKQLTAVETTLKADEAKAANVASSIEKKL